jgi:hypothetical protein
VYGGGGNTGAPYTNDFIELLNTGMTAVSLNGLSVQYGSAGGNTWTGVTALPDVMLNPGQYFLIQEASGGANGVPLPAADAVGTISMAAGSGKVALVTGTTALPAGCTNAAILDMVGYGTAICFEGAGTAPGLNNTTANFRAGNGCVDTDNNSADFAAAAPAPRNTASPTTTCTGGTPPTGVGASNPSSQCPGFDVTLSVTVSEGSPPSPIVSVIGDASSIGASPSLALLDDGVPPDATAGDSVYTATANVATGLPQGNQSVPVVITDQLNRTGNASITVTILNCNPRAFGVSRGFCNGETGVLTVNVTPGIMPDSTGLMVLVDMTPIGGPGLVSFHDDGMNGDATAGDNIFSYQVTIPAEQPAGSAVLSGGVLDDQGRSDTFMFSVNTTPCTPANSTVVISQVYGGGGNTGATLTHDYVVLFNRSNAAVDITGWTVQYASGSTMTGFLQATPLSGIIPPGGYYLVQEAQGAGGSQPLPPPDAVGTISMGATAGRVALVNSATLLDTDCAAASIMDLVGYGNLAVPTCVEGLFAAPVLTNTLANFRRDGGCFDNNQNGVDFFTGEPAPLNSASPVNLCSPGPACPCDFNNDSTLNSQDYFDFLTCFFGGGCPSGQDADYNNDGAVNSQDYFDFLVCFFAPPAGC